MIVVLDSSAVLALIRREPGAERVAAVIAGSLISAVNYAEVASRLVDLGMPQEMALKQLSGFGLHVVPFDLPFASTVMKLRPLTRRFGLSLGDRACLALAIREKATAVTADRGWAGLEVGCAIELIR